MNEVIVAGLVKAMKAQKNKDGVVDARYMGDMYQRGRIFKIVGTKFEGNMNELLEAAERAGIALNTMTSKPDPIVEKAKKKLAAAKRNSTPR